MASCAGCKKSIWTMTWKCTNKACGKVWCNDCAKGWVFRSCPDCGNRCE